MKLEDIISLIRLVLNKERRGAVKASEIREAIRHAERDLFSELLSIYKTTSVLPNKLQPFRASATKAFTAGSADLSTEAVEEIVAAEMRDLSGGSDRHWDAIVARDDVQWTRRRLSDIVPDEGGANPLHRYTQQVNGTTELLELPAEFLKFEGAWVTIGGERFPVQLVGADKWGSKKMSDLITDPENPEEPLWLNIEEDMIVVGSFTGDSAPVPSNVIKVMSFETILNGERHEGIVVAPDKFNSRSFDDLYKDGGVMKEHISKTESTITLTAGVGDLPKDFIRDGGVFYSGTRQGTVLDSKAYLDRVNSNFLAPTVEKPIARIVNGQVEVAPSSISSIKLQHYQFPNPKQSVLTVENGVIRVYPEPTEGVYVKSLKNPSERRPQIKVDNGNVQVSPFGTNDVTVEFLAFPTLKAPIVRLIKAEDTAGASPTHSMSVECLPANLDSGIIHYITKLIPSDYAWTISGRDYVFNSGGSTDTMFGDESVPDIASKALIYLGVSKQNGDAAQIEMLKQADKTKA
jgi:hypothetical protein